MLAFLRGSLNNMHIPTPWWCCKGWSLRSLICVADVVTGCRSKRICVLHDRAITEGGPDRRGVVDKAWRDGRGVVDKAWRGILNSWMRR